MLDPFADSILPLPALVSAKRFWRHCAGEELSDLLIWKQLSFNQLHLQSIT